MKHHLYILRQLRGLGFTATNISFRFDSFREEAVEVQITARRPGDRVLELRKSVPVYQIDQLGYDIHDDILAGLFQDAAKDFQEAVNRESEFMRPESTGIQLHGYCNHCGKTALYALPRMGETSGPTGPTGGHKVEKGVDKLSAK